MEKYEIDFVVTWVDGTDPVWRQKKEYWQEKENISAIDNSEERYRDWDLFKYWFRSVEMYAPWVNKVYLITDNQLPSWINIDCDKLVIVDHTDFLNSADLPVFNCNAIETKVGFIKGLSERFVYFNDDMVLNAPNAPEDYFVEGLPCDMLCLQPVIANPSNETMTHLFINNSLVLAKNFKKRENVKMQKGAYFHIGYPFKYFCYNILEQAFPQTTGYFSTHGPAPFLKSVFDEVWEREKDILNETCSHKFRNDKDVTNYLFREWQKLTGNFKPKNMLANLKYFEIGEDNSELLSCMQKGKTKCICLNDTYHGNNFELIRSDLSEAFEKKYPNKSSFEK